MRYQKIREEELKNKVGKDWFALFDTTEIIGNIDFTVFPIQNNLFADRIPLLWAEAKTGNFDVATMFVQLILTIGKARTFDKTLPPAFLGAFDFQKIAFVPYVNIQDIFFLNDFNWNVTPSNHETKEFKLVKERIEATLKQKTYVFDYEKDEKQLKTFIKNNIAKATTKSRIKIDKNNFIPIYLRWLETVKPIIDTNWDDLKKVNILDRDFYLADLFVDDKGTQNISDDSSIRDNLFVVYKNESYHIAKENIKQLFDANINIRHRAVYQNFWKLYKRPPIAEFQDYIIERQDLLVPQDIRERKGAYFTPRKWVELSQKYLTNYLGKDWQDEYYIWDCAAGTGNLLAGLTNKYHIYASTIDQADVNVMHERIDHGANLLKNHVFQFDFLNDAFFPSAEAVANGRSSQFPSAGGVSEGRGGYNTEEQGSSKLPKSLQEILKDPEKRKKLVIYINPPYAEATSAKTVTGTGENKAGVATSFKVKEQFNPIIGSASNEIFALFMAIIYEKMNGCILGQFSKLKFINGSNFKKFKNFFEAKYLGGFVTPAETFDNVKGKFPIGFTLWDTSQKETIETIATDVFDKNQTYLGEKKFFGNLPKSINKWIKLFDDKKVNARGFMENPTPDFQNTKFLNISEQEGNRHNNYLYIFEGNLIEASIYFSVRHCIEATWLNDRDQFLYPNEGWRSDLEFQNDCLAYTLFHGQNRITSKNSPPLEGSPTAGVVNHWIPFTEQEVNAQERFESHFMVDFIHGKIKTESQKFDFNSPPLEGCPQDGVVQKRNSKNYFNLPFNPTLKERAKELRKAGNLSEVLFWNQVKNKQFKGYDFDRQKIIGNYIVDFFCVNCNVVVEIDGSSHDDKQEYDANRDDYLKSLGLKVIHIPASDVLNHLNNVMDMLEEHEGFLPPCPTDTPPEEVFTPPHPSGTPLEEGNLKREFSPAATAVFDAGRELWKYYHTQQFPSSGGVLEGQGGYNPNASLYDIRAHFQGRNAKGRMNSKSTDETYTLLIAELRNALKALALQIQPKVYEYGFLKN